MSNSEQVEQLSSPSAATDIVEMSKSSRARSSMVRKAVDTGRKRKTRRGKKKRRIEYDEDGLKCSIKLRFCKGCQQWIVPNPASSSYQCGCLGMESPNLSREYSGQSEQEIFRKTLAYPVRSPSIDNEVDISFEDENRSFYMSPEDKFSHHRFGFFPSSHYSSASNDSANSQEFDLETCIDTDQFMKEDFENMYATAISNSLSELSKKELIDKIFELDRKVSDLENENKNKNLKFCQKLKNEQQELVEENQNLKKLLERAKTEYANKIEVESAK